MVIGIVRQFRFSATLLKKTQNLCLYNVIHSYGYHTPLNKRLLN